MSNHFWTDQEVLEFFQDEYLERAGTQPWAVMDSMEKWKRSHPNTHTVKAGESNSVFEFFQQKEYEAALNKSITESNVVDGKGKDWEIIKVKRKDNNQLIELDGRSIYDLSSSSDFYNITSVRRLSDNSVWTIGDGTNSGKITSFEIRDFGMSAVVKQLGGNCAIPLNALEKAKPILFTTEDGFNIYEGDEYWYVNSFLNIHKITATVSRQWDKMLMPNEKIFSTEESVKEYVLMNKPVLSLKEVHEALFLNYNSTLDTAYDKLKDIVEQKINK